jgi:E3 ubiquitin-protein ligase HERC3
VLLDNDRVKCWGSGAQGQLGLGSTANVGDQPQELGDALPFVETGWGTHVASLGQGSCQHVCATLQDGRLKCWGSNLHGELGQQVPSNYLGTGFNQMGDLLPGVELFANASLRNVPTR